MRTTETDSIQLAASKASRTLAPRLTIVRHPDPSLVGVGAPLGKEVVLGRESAFLAGALDHGRVSREHARVQRTKTAATVHDLGSRNGTVVNGLPLQEPTRLEVGDVVGVGPVLLLFHHAPRYVTTKKDPTVWSVSYAMSDVVEQVRRAASEDGNVVLVGETGVGKEVVAQALHEASGRAGDLVAVNCAALSDGVLQSELFGHERGAFSGADATKIGLVEAADRGTLFLDEIASASPALQAALLRVLQDRKVRRVGATEARDTDVRFIAALQDAEEAGRAALREDLWFRLARRIITIPPLRERREDVAYLAQRFAAQALERPVRLGRRLAWQLVGHDWPGNVRELESLVARLLVDHPPVEVDGLLELDVENVVVAPAAASTASAAPAQVTSPKTKRPRRRPARARLEALLGEHEGQVAAVARTLEVERKTVYRWLDALGIDPSAYRDAL